MIYKKSIGLFFFMISTFLNCQQSKNKNHDIVNSSDPKSTELFHITHISSGELNNPKLVLVLHGDAPFNNPSYQYIIAKKIADENKNIVAVGILRPGYKDNEGNSSQGERGEAAGDNYTREVLESINNLTTKLKDKYNPSKIVLVGHSGGAAISANLISEYPITYSNALLISCPCNLHKWRKHMKRLQPETQIWDKEVKSLSPIEGVKKIHFSTQITLIHGDNDKSVPINIASEYARELEENQKKFNFIVLEGLGHEVALNDEVFEIISKFVK
ncbi:alpha/beta hydrolase [Flagellimonas sp. HMM57]|uniref:alpha/beta hydrolase family protein n=1 Tax=unclassified Flagellimonas TaxID=2644544 RepID=UPI0013D6A461|nr:MULTISPECIES: prolyl oligopeptidase family serine peptidase [unclassified Flagellimonas]UII75338.1 alpha/beta hydrolase [Flagellimonas sp. HMM57]